MELRISEYNVNGICDNIINVCKSKNSKILIEKEAEASNKQDVIIALPEYADAISENAISVYGTQQASSAVDGVLIGVATATAKQLQKDLSDMGFYLSAIDGNLNSSKMQQAVKNFQRVFGYTITGKVTDAMSSITNMAKKYREYLNGSATKFAGKYGMDSIQKQAYALTMTVLRDSMGLSKYQTAGVMANIYAESAFSQDNAQNNKYPGIHNTNYIYTTTDSVGYGLLQWTYSTRKQGLLDMSKSMNSSTSSLSVQLAYFRYEMEKQYTSSWKKIKNASSYSAASDIFLEEIEKPAVKNYDQRREYAKQIYNCM